jgi:hypothetical protein
MAKLLACAHWHRAETMAAQVFCCERRNGLNKEERTGYLLSGFIALSPVANWASTPQLLPQGGEPFFIPLSKLISGQFSQRLTCLPRVI